MSLVSVYCLTLKQWQYSSSLNWPPASFPDPTQLSVTWSTEKQEKAWYLFSHEWCQDRRDGRKALIVCGAHWTKNTRAKVPGNLPHVSSKREETVVHTKHWVCVVCWKYAKHILLVLQLFAIFRLCMLMWEKIQGSPSFSVLHVTESWVGLRNEATGCMHLPSRTLLFPICGLWSLQITVHVRPLYMYTCSHYK